MKKIQIAGLTALTILGSLTAPQAQSAVTKPVGYETITLQPNQYNMVGARLHGAVAHTGTFETFTPTSLTDTEASFNLAADTNYIVELADGSNFNIIGSNASGSTITLPAVIAGDVQAYTIRVANTLNSVLGSPPNLGISTDGTLTGADIVWVQDGLGFKKYYYITVGAISGWYDAQGATADLGENVINPGAAVYIQTVGSTSGTTDITITGTVKTTSTAFVINQEWNLISSEYPAGATLDSSNLSAHVTPSTDGTLSGADIVWVPFGLGFKKYYYITVGAISGWYDAQGATADLGSDVLGPAFYIQDEDGIGGGAMTPPASYSGL